MNKPNTEVDWDKILDKLAPFADKATTDILELITDEKPTIVKGQKAAYLDPKSQVTVLRSLITVAQMLNTNALYMAMQLEPVMTSNFYLDTESDLSSIHLDLIATMRQKRKKHMEKT